MSVASRAGAGTVRRIAAVTVGLLVALLLGEGLLRVSGLGWYEARRDHYEMISVRTPSGDSVFLFAPGGLSWHEWDGDPYGTLPPGARLEYGDVRREGIRGALPPEDGTPRLLFMGDSFTFGEGVVLADTFVARTQAALVAEGVAVAALNSGVPGYGTHEERLRLPELLERFDPAVVVVVFAPNDAIHVSAAHARGHDLLRFVPEQRSSRVVALLERAWTARERARETEAWYLSFYAGDGRSAWDRARAELVEMRTLAHAHGAVLGVAYFPLLHSLADGPLDAIRDEVERACEQAQIPFLDLGPAFRGLDERDLWVHPVDHHPNARAHALAATALQPFVRGLLETR